MLATRFGSTSVYSSFSTVDALSSAEENNVNNFLYFRNYDALCQRRTVIAFDREIEEFKKIALYCTDKKIKLITCCDFLGAVAQGSLSSLDDFSLIKDFHQAKQEIIKIGENARSNGLDYRSCAFSNVIHLSEQEEHLYLNFLSTAINKSLDDKNVLIDVDPSTKIDLIHLKDAFYGFSQVIEANQKKAGNIIFTNVETDVKSAVDALKRISSFETELKIDNKLKCITSQTIESNSKKTQRQLEIVFKFNKVKQIAQEMIDELSSYVPAKDLTEEQIAEKFPELN